MMIERAYRGVQILTFGLVFLGFLLDRNGGLMMGVLMGGLATLVVSAGMNVVRNVLGI